MNTLRILTKAVIFLFALLFMYSHINAQSKDDAIIFDLSDNGSNQRIGSSNIGGIERFLVFKNEDQAAGKYKLKIERSTNSVLDYRINNESYRNGTIHKSEWAFDSLIVIDIAINDTLDRLAVINISKPNDKKGDDGSCNSIFFYTKRKSHQNCKDGYIYFDFLKAADTNSFCDPYEGAEHSLTSTVGDPTIKYFRKSDNKAFNCVEPRDSYVLVRYGFNGAVAIHGIDMKDESDLVAPPITTSGNNFEKSCKTSSKTLRINSSDNYSWKVTGPFYSKTKSNSQSFTFDDTFRPGMYIVKIERTCCPDDVSRTVEFEVLNDCCTVAPAVTISPLLGNTSLEKGYTICGNGSQTVTLTADNTAGGISYNWSFTPFPSMNNSASPGSGRTKTLTEPGIYNYSVTSSCGTTRGSFSIYKCCGNPSFETIPDFKTFEYCEYTQEPFTLSMLPDNPQDYAKIEWFYQSPSSASYVPLDQTGLSITDTRIGKYRVQMSTGCGSRASTFTVNQLPGCSEPNEDGITDECMGVVDCRIQESCLKILKTGKIGINTTNSNCITDPCEIESYKILSFEMDICDGSCFVVDPALPECVTEEGWCISWDNDQGVSMLQDGTYEICPLVGSTKYTLIISDENEIISTQEFNLNKLSGSTPLTVTISDASNICQGAVDLSVTSEISDASFFWSGPNGLRLTGPQITTSVAGEWRVRSYGDAGCFATSRPIQVVPNPILGIVISKTGDFCTGDYTLTADGSANGSWYDPEGQEIGSGNKIRILSPIEGEYKYRETLNESSVPNSITCTRQGAYFVSNSINISANDIITTTCGDNFTLSLPIGYNFSFWECPNTFNGGCINNSLPSRFITIDREQLVSDTRFGDTKYFISIKKTNFPGCRDRIELNINRFSIEGNLTISSSNTFICGEESIILTTDQGIENVTWVNQNGLVIGTGSQIAISSAGTYKARYFNNSCNYEASITITNGSNNQCTEICNNDVDDNGDGFTDCEESSCFSFSDIQNAMQGIDFYETPIEVQTGLTGCATVRNDNGIVDHANKIFTYDDGSVEGLVCIPDEISRHVDLFRKEGITGTTYILDANSFCDGKFDDWKDVYNAVNDGSSNLDYVETYIIIDNKEGPDYLYQRYDLNFGGVNSLTERELKSKRVPFLREILKFAFASALDAFFQTIGNKVGNPNVNSWDQATDEIDYYSVVASGLGALIPMRKSKLVKCAGEGFVIGFAVVVKNATNEDDYTVGQGFADFSINVLSSTMTCIITDYVFGKFTNKNIEEGIAKTFEKPVPSITNSTIVSGVKSIFKRFWFFIEKSIYKLGDKFEAWGALFSDKVLRKNQGKLAKVDNHAKDFDKKFDDIGNEFAAVPSSQKSGWVDHLEYRTNGNKVNKAGNKSGDYNSFGENSDVPKKYSDDSRFNVSKNSSNLAFDPATGNLNSKTRQEAMAGLEAEAQDLVTSPIRRDPSGGAEFIDGNGIDWDVKAPPSQGLKTLQQIAAAGDAIKDELTLTNHKVILDTTWMTDRNLLDLRAWLQKNVSSSDLKNIVEVNSNLF